MGTALLASSSPLKLYEPSHFQLTKSGFRRFRGETTSLERKCLNFPVPPENVATPCGGFVLGAVEGVEAVR